MYEAKWWLFVSRENPAPKIPWITESTKNAHDITIGKFAQILPVKMLR